MKKELSAKDRSFFCGLKVMLLKPLWEGSEQKLYFAEAEGKFVAGNIS